MDRPITANDIYYALKATSKNKAPGPDGLPIDYYFTDLPLWCKILESVYGSQFSKGRMSKFQRRAQVCLLYKKGDKSDPGNYRPITLLNVDAKIGPKVIAKRLGDLLPHLLEEDQYGFVPGRDIRNAHLRFQALQEICQRKQSKAGGVLLDFAKAFDSVIWDALVMVLEHFGFGDNFVRWILTFFKGTLVSILFNGSPLAPFELGVGVRQGDPISPALFVIFIEPMLNFIRSKLGDSGIKLENSTQPHSVLSFADDCTGILEDLNQAGKFLSCVEEFCTASGMKLNKSKTVILPFTPWTLADRHLKHRLDALGVKVLDNDEHTKLLGIPYGPALLDTERLSILIDSVHKRCILWQYRARTLHGKAVILNQVILPIIWYTASVCFIPKSGFQDQVTKLIRRFMSNSMGEDKKQPSALAEQWWNVPKMRGGLGIIPLETNIDNLQLSALNRLIMHARRSPTMVASWAAPVIQLFDSAISPWGHDFDILYAPVTSNPNHAISRRSDRWTALGKFWHHTLYVWNTKMKSHRTMEATAFEVLSTPMWNNYDLRPYSQQHTFAYKPTKIVRVLAELQILTPGDLFQVCGCPASGEILSEMLSTIETNRAFSVVACNKLLSKLHPLLSRVAAIPVGPLTHKLFSAAQHSWEFKKREIEDWKPSTGRVIMQRASDPVVPVHRLGNTMSFDKNTWKQDFRRNLHILPVYADFLFRMKHNALVFGY
ncbi:Pollike protein, partial [Globisporangium polare]